jgi:hypothetical protein
MKHFQLFEAWLRGGHGVVSRPTGTFTWKKAKGQITENTQKLLDLMQENFHDVAIFSWHPNIKLAQYGDIPKSFWPDTSGKRTNINRRSWIIDSIIVKRRKDKPKEERTFEDGRILDKIFKHFPMLNSSGGSGDTEEGRHVTQRQISFLTNGVGTHEKASEIKDSTFTPGAYTFKDNEWYFIPDDDFNPLPNIQQTRENHLKMLADMFSHWPTVENVQMQANTWSTTQPTLKIALENGGSRSIRIEDVSYTTAGEYNYTVTLTPAKDQPDFGRHGRDARVECEGISKMIKEIEIFPSDIAEKLAENPKEYKTILHEYRGRASGKTFGF